MMKTSSLQNQLQLEISEPLKNIGYINENHNIMLWINVLITDEPTIQYPHIYHRHKIMMMNDICGGNK